ncbi:UDP-N-acetylmuramoylalanyl-D-glutamate--2,6-diaminopimelate ligase [Olavius algarvensis spirochete endosymbiont]|nr:UDP-N-acetylmuramoylalanyl-D-glutamate--2,6-diaminopimelate ligase [Olavius algarvensis spirochete endosymbiont]
MTTRNSVLAVTLSKYCKTSQSGVRLHPMGRMPLEYLIPVLSPLNIRGDTKKTISSIAFNSKQASSGTLFFALSGIHVDGHQYIDSAIEKGAQAIMHSKALATYQPGITYIQVKNAKRALSRVSSAFYQHPSQELTTIGVTGTDGKSTTVSLIRQLLEYAGIPTGIISSTTFKTGGEEKMNYLRQSTPEAPYIHAMLREMLNRNQSHVVIEATSHGLSPINCRLDDVKFDVAVFTNLSREHLEFHGNIENYREDKTRLFRMMAKSRNPRAFGVVNADDEASEYFVRAAGKRTVLRYSIRNQNVDIFATRPVVTPDGTEFLLHTPEQTSQCRIRLPGLFNVENTLAALCTAAELKGINVHEFTSKLPELRGVKGRMETIRGNMDFHVFVDYAHSLGGFKKVLPLLKTFCTGRLILIFGTAGERDPEKRPHQGAVAAKYADMVFLSDDDPHSENPEKILTDIARGVATMTLGENLFLIPDRRQAIFEAMKRARKGDVVAALGKGHESSIIYANHVLPWDEAEVCREALRSLNFEA